MPQTVKALVKPSLLIWARKKSGLSIDEIARRLSITPARYNDWEAGSDSPSVAKLRDLADLYKRPLAVFYLPAPPLTFDTPKDFRLLPASDQGRMSHGLRMEIERANFRREVAIELDTRMGIVRPVVKIDRPDRNNPELFAKKARELLGISFEQQFSWRDAGIALKEWITILEDLGLLVFQVSRIDVSEMRGFVINKAPLPVIVLNGADTPNGRIFSLIHEFVHVLLETDGICNMLENGHSHNHDQQTEVFCNHVAGAILVPEEALVREEVVGAKGADMEWSDEEIRKLSRRFSVSKEVILRRLLIIGRTTPEFYQARRGIYLQEKKPDQEKDSAGGPMAHVVTMRNLGKSFLRLVFSAYYREVINTSNLADYLGVKLGQVWKIEKNAETSSLSPGLP